MTLATDNPTPPALQVLPKPITFDQFIEWYPENSEFRYELRRGAIVEMPKARGEHSAVAGFSHDELAIEIRQRNYPYLIPRECVVKVSDDTGYEPDLIVLDRAAIANEPRWSKASTIENGASIKLVIEVVSTNWQDDYEVKMSAYEALQIPEYWIVDYAGLGGVRHIGKPKQPTLLVYVLVDGEYEVTLFRGDDRILSPAFPELELTAAQIFQATN
jgi:Uma2 family endonuclease